MIYINLVQLVKRGKQLNAELVNFLSWKPFQRASLLNNSCGGHRVQNLYHSAQLINKGRKLIDMPSSETYQKMGPHLKVHKQVELCLGATNSIRLRFAQHSSIHALVREEEDC